MKLTFDTLFNDPIVVNAVIDRIQAQQKDPIFWQRYLSFEETKARTFKTYFGTQTGVVMGSVIDKNSGKPIRARKSIGSGFGEVASLGDRYQLDNDRLDMIQLLIDKFNANNNIANLTTILDYVYDDMRQVLLAPHKRMDKFVGDLRSTGTASIDVDNNPDGVELLDVTIPAVKETISSEYKDSLISYLQGYIQEKRSTIGTVGVMEMNRKTFNTRIKTSSEFQNSYKSLMGSSEIAIAGGLITDAMANEMFTGIGLPMVRIVEEYVDMPDGSSVNTFADDRIALLPSDRLGNMKWHQPYEPTDPVPGKTYTQRPGGHYISSQRTDEGRFLEYGCEWMAEFTAPQRIAILNTSSLV